MTALTTQSLTNPLVRQKARFDPIVVRAFETRTGRVVATVPYVGQPVWSFGVNQAGAWSVTVPLDNPEVDPDWLSGITEPWRISWAICQGSKIWQAGPVIPEDYQGGTTTTVSGGGLWKLLSDKRVLVNPARATLAGVARADADIAFGPGTTSDIGSAIPLANRNLSLQTVAKRIMQIITAAAGGDLPIAYPADIAGDAVRTYPGYDLAYVGQRLTELTQVLDGPEIEFRPEFVDEVSKQQIRWRMRIGNPHLGNLAFVHAFDYGRALVDLTYSVDGTARATRDYERGNGMNRDLVSGFSDFPLASGDPAAILLERVGADHTSTADRAVLDGWAQAGVLNNLVVSPDLKATVRIPGDDGQGNATRSPILTTVEAGDNCMAQIKRHPRIPDGLIGLRIAGANSTTKSQVAQLQLQYLGRAS